MSKSSAASKLPVPSPSGSSDLVSEVSRIVSGITGVQLGERQREMVQSRMMKRMLELQISSEADYLEHLNAHRTEEVEALVSLLTTHHTYFFREFSHFEYLEKVGLKTAVEASKARGEKTIRIWSSACSYGQEVYSLAMFIKCHLSRIAPGFSFEILGTDVDPESVAIASNGVYNREELKEAPLQYVSGNWAKGTGDIAEFVKAKADLKQHCKFEVTNLLTLSTSTKRKFDIIFCRNVFIYFTQEQIRKITSNLIAALHPDGLLFLGISESLNGLDLPVSLLGPSIYTQVRKTEVSAEKTASVPASAPRPLSLVPAPAVLRVMCVDDSPSVVTLLKQVLNKQNGFEVVATATNGIEAAKKLKETQVDLMTLDIHMPEQTGLEYLRQNMGSAHPPVVMISSVSREDAGLAMNCLEAGASDYVEKPALSNLKERGDEIRMKLLCAYRSKREGVKSDLSLEKSFATLPKIQRPEGCFRVVVASLADQKKLQSLLKEFQGDQPPTLILMEGCESALGEFSKRMSSSIGKEVTAIGPEGGALLPGKFYVADFSKVYDRMLSEHKAKKTSILVYGQVTSGSVQKILNWSGAQLLVEDLPQVAGMQSLRDVASDVAPATSFAYCSTDYLSKGRS